MQLFTHLLSSYLQGMGDFFSALHRQPMGQKLFATFCPKTRAVSFFLLIFAKEADMFGLLGTINPKEERKLPYDEPTYRQTACRPPVACHPS